MHTPAPVHSRHTAIHTRARARAWMCVLVRACVCVSVRARARVCVEPTCVRKSVCVRE